MADGGGTHSRQTKPVGAENQPRSEVRMEGSAQGTDASRMVMLPMCTVPHGSPIWILNNAHEEYVTKKINFNCQLTLT